MIARASGALLDRLADRRRRALEALARRPIETQKATLLDLVRRARDTRFGRRHDFAGIRSIADYQVRVAVAQYLHFRPLWARALEGERDVTWPGRPRHWVKTSGTTAGDKIIPVTAEAFASHRKGGWDALLLAAAKVGGRHLLGGPLLFLGGCTSLAPIGANGLVGDLSGLVVRRLPPGLRGSYSPGLDVSSIPDWETRLAAAARRVARQDLRLLSGMPSWLLILFDEVSRLHPDLTDRWPNLAVLIHGGVAFAPYRPRFDERLGRPLECIEVYPASEAFVAVQTEATGGLTLMLDYGIFYEFVPVEDLGLGRPRRHTVADVELHRNYAVVVSTPAGLWSYVLGDTVRFTARDPLRLVITGRVHHFVNAFGENVIVEEVERAMMTACDANGAEVVEFTVAPRYPSATDPRGGHDWIVEFHRPPRDGRRFIRSLDTALTALNTDYRIKRAGDVGMTAPRVMAVPAGTFHRWMRTAGQLGDQRKVPRVTNHRELADALLAAATPTADDATTVAG
jgi:hypothetical protein